jgi:ring-1,2-phenylacetyl-CoA epoxidase subunit PaaD
MQPGDSTTAIPVTLEQVWAWLDEVLDPEIPVISVVDLGIVRDVRWEKDGDDVRLVVTVTPTYSGCPATAIIARDIETALRERGIEALRLETRIAPPWTTDWISETGRRRLREFGIAPPADRSGSSLRPPTARQTAIECPRCGSPNTVKVSEFGSTPCKAQYQCRECLEPFDYFKCM